MELRLIGADPEFIVRSIETGLPVSMAECYHQGKLFTAYGDNVLLELNFAPVKPEYFAEHIEKIKAELNDWLLSQRLFYDIGDSSAEYPADQLCSKKAHEIGCEPFSCAYMPGVALVPPVYEDNKRFAGGHIHLCYKRGLAPANKIVKALDTVLKDKEVQDEARDNFYGMRGAFRVKPYGLEYRSLSNAWWGNPQALVNTLMEVAL